MVFIENIVLLSRQSSLVRPKYFIFIYDYKVHPFWHVTEHIFFVALVTFTIYCSSFFNSNFKTKFIGPCLCFNLQPHTFINFINMYSDSEWACKATHCFFLFFIFIVNKKAEPQKWLSICSMCNKSLHEGGKLYMNACD